MRDFPTNEDLSTPEAAYASLTRAWVAEGEAAFSRLSVSELARTMPFAPTKPMAVKEAEKWLEAEVLEVNVYRETNAVVFAKKNFGGKERVDVRWLAPENGRWLNNRNTVVETLDEARSLFSRQCSIEDVKIKLPRPPIANPQEYLHPFVEFLRRAADDPQRCLLQALADHRVVILGEVHHRPRYWAFNSSLVRDKAFAERAGVIYMELPGNDQPLVEKFLAAPKSDPQPIIEMLRGVVVWVGWPDQAMLDFFKAVWEVNQGLPREQRLRIVLTDVQCPWKDITSRGDFNRLAVDRDQVMAENVLRDLREHSADPRHALFIVGCGHAMVNLTVGGEPMKSAGWRLREKLGDTNVFAVFPHSPVIANEGGVNGRIALGLFETAFSALANRPMAFPLDHGPFGEQVFDASMDDVTADTFRNGYQAYLYLGPLDDESVSPLIPGYVTDDFAKELDRRSRLMYGKSLVELEGGPKSLNAEILVQWYKQAWGQPRLEWSARSLGPLRAWEWGSDWQKKLVAARLKDWWPQDKEVIRQSALRLFQAIRQANYEDPGPSQTFPAPDVDYQVYTDYPSWMGWICQHFRTNPIVAVDLGGITMNTNGLPALAYKVTLKNGGKLEGVLPMNYNPRSERWYGVEGLDWHLKTPSTN
ncbi:MAG: hypothetical protein ACLQM8_00650 [Limisphaerales bacterium]